RFTAAIRSRTNPHGPERPDTRRPAPPQPAAVQCPIPPRSQSRPPRLALSVQGFREDDGGMEGVNASTTEREPAKLTFSRIVRRLPLYFGLAFAGLAVMTSLVALSIHLGMTGYITGGWIGFVGYTGLLFWVVVRNARPH